MKKELYTAACLLLLASCSDSASEQIKPEGRLYPVQYNVCLDKEILPFSSTRRMPETNVPEPIAVEQELDSLCSSIEYVVYDGNSSSAPLKHRTYHTGDEDFGIIYDTLPEGSYRVSFLAHQAKSAAFAGNVFSFDSITDTFLDTTSFIIGEEDSDISRDITLRRIVCRVELRASDAVPEDIGRFDISVTNHSSAVSILSGEGIASSSAKMFSYGFETSDIGKTGKTHSFLTFIPAATTKLTAVTSALSTEGKVLRSRTIADILPIADKIIRYTGRLYTFPGPNEAEGTFTLSIEGGGVWSDEEEIELAE